MTMKKIAFIIAALALTLVSCNKEQVVPVNQDVDEIEAVNTDKVLYEITVSIDPDTRAAMTDKKLTFAANDKIAVIGTKDETASVVELTVSKVEENKVTFSTTIDSDMTIGDYAYYPVSIANALTPTTINWPSTFDGTKVEIPMMAVIDVTKNTAVFKHLGALLKVTLASVPTGANSLEFTTTNNFVGTYDVSTSDWGLTGNTLSSSVETLSISGNKTYYIPVPAGSYSDFALAMKQKSYYHKQRTASLTSAIEPARGNIVNLGTFTYDVDKIEEWWHQSDINGWTNGYNRYIKTSATTYQLTVFNSSSSTNDKKWKWKLVDGDNKAWCTAKADYWSGALEQKDWDFYRTGSDDKTFYVTLTTDGSSWTYNSGNWENNSDRNYDASTTSLYLSTSLDTYSNDGTDTWDNIPLTKYNYNDNYSYKYEGLVVPDNSTYSFKIHAAGSDWSWWIGGNSVAITDSKPYATAVSSDGDDMTFTLTPGTYDFYLDIAVLNFMFVKRAYSE